MNELEGIEKEKKKMIEANWFTNFQNLKQYVL